MATSTESTFPPMLRAQSRSGIVSRAICIEHSRPRALSALQHSNDQKATTNTQSPLPIPCCLDVLAASCSSRTSLFYPCPSCPSSFFFPVSSRLALPDIGTYVGCRLLCEYPKEYRPHLLSRPTPLAHCPLLFERNLSRLHFWLESPQTTHPSTHTPAGRLVLSRPTGGATPRPTRRTRPQRPQSIPREFLSGGCGPSRTSVSSSGVLLERAPRAWQASSRGHNPEYKL